jgi:hypothetical protein
MIDNLCDDNFIIFAIKAYDKPNVIKSEFEEELKRIKYVKRLIQRYKVTGELKERLILNHIIILSNVFGVDCSVRMLFFKLNKEHYSILKTFLLFLSMLPEYVRGINGININTRDIQVDLFIAKRLKSL